MDISIATCFIETTIPLGVTFNEWGVALKGLEHRFEVKNLSVTFRVCALNGLWGGEVTLMGKTWGLAQPILKWDSFKFLTFEECTTYLWRLAENNIIRNSGDTEVHKFKGAMDKWFMASSEDKLKCFKEVDFYAR